MRLKYEQKVYHDRTQYKMRSLINDKYRTSQIYRPVQNGLSFKMYTDLFRITKNFLYMINPGEVMFIPITKWDPLQNVT